MSHILLIEYIKCDQLKWCWVALFDPYYLCQSIFSLKIPISLLRFQYVLSNLKIFHTSIPSVVKIPKPLSSEALNVLHSIFMFIH